jgi:hypothetical protein
MRVRVRAANVGAEIAFNIDPRLWNRLCRADGARKQRTDHSDLRL